MLPRDSEGVERCQVSGLASRLHIEFRAHAPDEFRFAAYSGKHSGEKEQVARLYRLRINTERLGRGRKLDAKFLQSLLGAGRPRASPGYHFPACTPPSTCKISPVVNVASVRNKTASTTSLISPILPMGCNPFRES